MAATTIRCSTVRQMGRESAGTLIQGSMPECAGALLERFGGSVQMIYLDPPFNTGKVF